MTRIVHGDSIAYGTGVIGLHCPTNAREGAASPEVLLGTLKVFGRPMASPSFPGGTIMKPASEALPRCNEVVLSVGSNDPTSPYLPGNANAIRSLVDPGALVVWIVPRNPTAAAIIKTQAAKLNDGTVEFAAGPDRIHPTSYSVVARDVDATFAAMRVRKPQPAPVPSPTPAPASSAAVPNRKAFFDLIRATLFQGRISQSQVDGLNSLLDAVPVGMPIEHQAYCLATTYHETAATMQPIEEYGKGWGHAYGQTDPATGKAYYGRGYVQLTWKANYASAGAKIGSDLVNHPELALVPMIAARVLYRGMTEGWFTGVGLPTYFRPGYADPVNARRIVNGTDQAAKIANHYAHCLAALKAGATAAPVAVKIAFEPPMPDPATLAA